MVNELYVEWLAVWIKNGTINVKTGQPFTIDDIKNTDYKVAVQNKLVE